MTAHIASVVALALVVFPAAASAEARQLQLSLRGGFATSGGALAAPSGALEVGGWYGLSDAFSLYADAGYALGGADYGLRHGGYLAVGAVYGFDVVRVVPYLGLGARFDAVAGDDQLVLSPSVEARGGVYYLLRRGLALDLQAAYAFPFVGRDLSSDHVSVTFGVRFLTEP
ncbi:MAG: hypothetical protein R3A48_09170 [Polyangiales bacterium]